MIRSPDSRSTLAFVWGWKRKTGPRLPLLLLPQSIVTDPGVRVAAAIVTDDVMALPPPSHSSVYRPAFTHTVLPGPSCSASAIPVRIRRHAGRPFNPQPLPSDFDALSTSTSQVCGAVAVVAAAESTGAVRRRSKSRIVK